MTYWKKVQVAYMQDVISTQTYLTSMEESLNGANIIILSNDLSQTNVESTQVKRLTNLHGLVVTK
jgi:hypothetical protein